MQELAYWSTGWSADCPECSTDGPRDGCIEFSWVPCDVCGSRLGGARYIIHAREGGPSGPLVHMEVCLDCIPA